jgi:hypothetical protein
MANQLAKQSVIACARLAGFHSQAEGEAGVPPDNPSIKKALMAMLTPYLARKLTNPNPAEVSTAKKKRKGF